MGRIFDLDPAGARGNLVLLCKPSSSLLVWLCQHCQVTFEWLHARRHPGRSPGCPLAVPLAVAPPPPPPPPLLLPARLEPRPTAWQANICAKSGVWAARREVGWHVGAVLPRAAALRSGPWLVGVGWRG